MQRLNSRTNTSQSHCWSPTQSHNPRTNLHVTHVISCRRHNLPQSPTAILASIGSRILSRSQWEFQWQRSAIQSTTEGPEGRCFPPVPADLESCDYHYSVCTCIKFWQTKLTLQLCSRIISIHFWLSRLFTHMRAEKSRMGFSAQEPNCWPRLKLCVGKRRCGPHLSLGHVGDWPQWQAKLWFLGGRYTGSLHCKRYEDFKHVQEVLGKWSSASDCREASFAIRRGCGSTRPSASHLRIRSHSSSELQMSYALMTASAAKFQQLARSVTPRQGSMSLCQKESETHVSGDSSVRGLRFIKNIPQPRKCRKKNTCQLHCFVM